MSVLHTRRRLGIGVGAALLTALATVAVPEAASADGGFHTSAPGVRVRAAATTGSAQVSSIAAAGTAIDIKCQTVRETVSASGFGTSAIWDKLNGYGDGYISDLFVKETVYAKRDSRLPTCGDPSTPPPATTRRSITYNPFAAGYSNQCTYYAEERMHQATGLYMPVTGNAYQWADQARAAGWTVGTAPAVNSVAVFPRGAFQSQYGHVAWVIGLGSGTLHIQDYNWNNSGAHVTDHSVSIPAGTQFIYSDR